MLEREGAREPESQKARSEGRAGETETQTITEEDGREEEPLCLTMWLLLHYTFCICFPSSHLPQSTSPSPLLSPLAAPRSRHAPASSRAKRDEPRGSVGGEDRLTTGAVDNEYAHA